MCIMTTTAKRIVKISKYLSYHLRHRPDLLGLELNSAGWIEVERLLEATNKHNFPISLTDLETVVAQSDKQRFSFDRSKTLIRANQGHSVAVDLELTPLLPPALLYHGTHYKALASIMDRGLCKMQRHHVHLSEIGRAHV